MRGNIVQLRRLRHVVMTEVVAIGTGRRVKPQRCQSADSSGRGGFSQEIAGFWTRILQSRHPGNCVFDPTGDFGLSVSFVQQ